MSPAMAAALFSADTSTFFGARGWVIHITESNKQIENMVLEHWPIGKLLDAD